MQITSQCSRLAPPCPIAHHHHHHICRLPIVQPEKLFSHSTTTNNSNVVNGQPWPMSKRCSQFAWCAPHTIKARSSRTDRSRTSSAGLTLRVHSVADIYDTKKGGAARKQLCQSPEQYSQSHNHKCWPFVDTIPLCRHQIKKVTFVSIWSVGRWRRHGFCKNRRRRWWWCWPHRWLLLSVSPSLCVCRVCVLVASTFSFMRNDITVRELIDRRIFSRGQSHAMRAAATIVCGSRMHAHAMHIECVFFFLFHVGKYMVSSTATATF